MLRFLLRIWRWMRAEIVFGFLIATVFWIAVLGWQAAYAPTDAEKQKCHEATEQSSRNREECKSFWERTTSDPVAFFTFWLVVSTLGLSISTIMLWIAGEKQFRHARRASIVQSRDMKASVNETQRIGEAQIRAYVDISSSEIFFVDLGVLNIDAHPMVRIIATNTGQSPARNFIWNPTVQYFSTGRSSSKELGSNWRDILGVGIAVGQSHSVGAMVPEMELLKFLGESDGEKEWFSSVSVFNLSSRMFSTDTIPEKLISLACSNVRKTKNSKLLGVKHNGSESSAVCIGQAIGQLKPAQISHTALATHCPRIVHSLE
jgi:hypothetical protein